MKKQCTGTFQTYKNSCSDFLFNALPGGEVVSCIALISSVMGPQGYLSTAVVQSPFCQDEFELGRRNRA